MSDTEDEGFIGLPPGMLDSGTFKTPARTERPRSERPEIVFVPTAPGAPLPPVEPASPAEPALGAVPPAAPPSEPSAETRRDLGDEAAPPVPARRGWALRLADGTTVAVAHRLLVGRNPARPEGWEDAELLGVQDATQSVSKTHAAFEVDESGLWVHDLDSTNGVWVVVGEDVTEAVPGRRVAVPEGASVELGDYVLHVARS